MRTEIHGHRIHFPYLASARPQPLTPSARPYSTLTASAPGTGPSRLECSCQELWCPIDHENE